MKSITAKKVEFPEVHLEGKLQEILIFSWGLYSYRIGLNFLTLKGVVPYPIQPCTKFHATFRISGNFLQCAYAVLKLRFWMDSEATASGFDDSEDEYDVNYLQHCKKIRFISKDGDPAVSVYSGHCRFPTPIACRTRAKLNL